MTVWNPIESAAESEVGEVQGIYGPLFVAEGWIQLAWLKQAFVRGRLQTVSGASLKILFPGYWNHRAGPDFRDAVLEIGGNRLRGDIEIHLYRDDWWHHGHWSDPEYNRCVLHVSFFQSENQGSTICLESGKCVPEWIMAPWLSCDLEDLISEGTWKDGKGSLLTEWVRSVENREHARELLWERARERWRRKCEGAATLKREFGDYESFHLLALMILGFPENRGQFLELGIRFPRKLWADSDNWQRILLEGQRRWTWRGGRPANHPRRRLEQYCELTRAHPHWIESLVCWLRLEEPCTPEKACLPSKTAKIRRQWSLGRRFEETCPRQLRCFLSHHLLNRIIVDGFLPLMADSSETLVEEVAWLHWPPGDSPNRYREAARELGLMHTAGYPFANGWIQGFIGRELELRGQAETGGSAD